VTRQRRVRGILAMSPCACSRVKQRLTFALAFFGSSTADDSESVYNIVNCRRFGIWRLSMSGLSDRQLCGDEFGFMSVSCGSSPGTQFGESAAC
jgi:hypothetical protein